MTAQELRRIDPFLVIVDRLRSSLFAWITQVALAINHDQKTLDAMVVRTLLEVGEIFLILGFVLEELIDVLHRVDLEFLLRRFGEL